MARLNKRELEFRVDVYVWSEEEAVRIADDWRLHMEHATKRWAQKRGYTERGIIEEKKK